MSKSKKRGAELIFLKSQQALEKGRENNYFLSIETDSYFTISKAPRGSTGRGERPSSIEVDLQLRADQGRDDGSLLKLTTPPSGPVVNMTSSSNIHVFCFSCYYQAKHKIKFNLSRGNANHVFRKCKYTYIFIQVLRLNMINYINDSLSLYCIGPCFPQQWVERVIDTWKGWVWIPAAGHPGVRKQKKQPTVSVLE